MYLHILHSIVLHWVLPTACRAGCLLNRPALNLHYKCKWQRRVAQCRKAHPQPRPFCRALRLNKAFCKCGPAVNGVVAAPDRCWAGTGCSKLPSHGSESSGKNRSLPHFCSVMCAVIWMLYASLCFVMGTLATCGPLRANVPRHGWCRVCLAMVSIQCGVLKRSFPPHPNSSTRAGRMSRQGLAQC